MAPFFQNVTSVRIGDGIVHLDLRSDSYSCEYAPHALSLTSRLVTSEAALDHHIMSDDVRLKDNAARAHGWSKSDIGTSDILFFVRALARTLLSFPGRPLAAILSRAAGDTQQNIRQSSVSAEQLTLKFNRMVMFLPFKPLCLFSSFLLLNYLHLQGSRADWFFGAQLFPFRAHCWLAVESRPLNDRPDRVAFYTPILVLRGSAS